MVRRAFSFLYVDVEAAARETKRLTKRFTDPKLVLIYQGVRLPSVDWSRGGINVLATDKPQIGVRVVGTLETITGKRIGARTTRITAPSCCVGPCRSSPSGVDLATHPLAFPFERRAVVVPSAPGPSAPLRLLPSRRR
jgi:hypothetical protein